MSESDSRQRQEEALQLLTVRMKQDRAAWDSVITADLAGADPAEVLARLIAMTDLASGLVHNLAHHFGVAPEEYLRTYAVFLAGEHG